MIRITMLSLAMFVLAAATEGRAAAPPLGDKEGFRVYSVGARCGQRQLLGVYDTARDALHAASEFRSKGSRRIEVTTGTEGKRVPTGQPAVYHIYTKVCDKSGWRKEAGVVGGLRLAEVVKSHETKKVRVEVVADHKPEGVFHVYGGGCSRSWRLMGTYASAREACEAAQQVRTVQKLRNCLVTTGDKGEDYWSLGKPAEFEVYAESCKAGWVKVATRKDAKEAEEFAAERKQGVTGVEIVRRYTSRGLE